MDIDYDAVPVETLDGVEPVFVRAMMRQQMAALYQKAVPDLSASEATDAATASWETEWPDDPAPRTFDALKQVVFDDLSYWSE